MQRYEINANYYLRNTKYFIFPIDFSCFSLAFVISLSHGLAWIDADWTESVCFMTNDSNKERRTITAHLSPLSNYLHYWFGKDNLPDKNFSEVTVLSSDDMYAFASF